MYWKRKTFQSAIQEEVSQKLNCLLNSKILYIIKISYED